MVSVRRHCSKFFKNGEPVLLTLVYYNCPLLCNLLLNGFVEGLKQGTGIPEGGLNVLSISIDPREDEELGLAKRASYLKQLGDQKLFGSLDFHDRRGTCDQCLG